jgi:hypothetical protein
MYGQPLQPNRADFTFCAGENGDDPTETDFSIGVGDLDDPKNDDIREVDHPLWEDFWDNICENAFVPNTDPGETLDTMTKARAWLLSIGMTEKP